MAIRKISIRSLFLPILFSLWLTGGAWVQAQSPGTSGAFSPEIRYSQRLTWAGGENASRYEVIVEKDDGGGEFRRVMQQFTEAVYIEFSLPPGKYRYQVTPYDVLDRPASESPWMNFEILAAVKPELFSFSPGFLLFDPDTEFVLNLSGRNLLRDAQIYLRQIGSSNAPVVPVTTVFNQDESGVRLSFTYDQFQPGFYVIFVKNPGGQETSKGELVVGYPEMDPNYTGNTGGSAAGSGKKLLDTHIGMLWTPMIHLYGGIDEIFDEDMYFTSAAVHFGMFIYKPTWIFQPGLELGASWYGLKGSFEGYDAEVQAMTGTIYLSMMRWLAVNAAAVVFRFGWGMGYQTGVYNKYEEDDWIDVYSMNGTTPHGEVGIAFILTFKNHFAIEFGIHYTHMLVEENPSGYLKPFLGFGWQF